MKREEYIDCDRCGDRFDPGRETKLGFSSLRCPSCGQDHDHSDAMLGDIVDDAEEPADDDRPEWSWETQAVYVIASESGPLKIGVSKNPESRKRNLQVGHPHDLELLVHNFECQANSLERNLHQIYSDHRLNGEWFKLPEPKVRELITFVEMGEIP